MYALVDCNNFYASCERVFAPHLNNKPVVVLSNNDGCVIARSKEAKELGIPMAAPAYKFESLFEENNVHVFSSNYALYADMSNRVMNILANAVAEIDVYSIDEAFLDLSNIPEYNFFDFALNLRTQILKWTGIPVCIGIAPTKTLAKIANRIAKKYLDKTQGVHVINTERLRIKAIRWSNIDSIWGIGENYSNTLALKRVKNGYDFTQINDEWIQKKMSKVGVRLKKELEGIPSIKIEEVKSKKTISTTRTFEKPQENYNEIEERINTFAITCAEKLRKQQSICSALIVTIGTNRFAKKEDTYFKAQAITLPHSTNSTIEILEYSIKALKIIFRRGYKYTKAGVILVDIQSDLHRQLNLFKHFNKEENSLMKTIDNINANYGTGIIKFACQDLERTWKMKQEHLSPSYTTNINDILKVPNK